MGQAAVVPVLLSVILYSLSSYPQKNRLSTKQSIQLVDIIKLGLNSKIKKFSYSFICGKGYSPPKGRIAFCLQPEAASCRLHSVDMPRFTLRCKARNFVFLPSCERSRLSPSQLKKQRYHYTFFPSCRQHFRFSRFKLHFPEIFP